MTAAYRDRPMLHPLQAYALSAVAPFFAAATLSDWQYFTSAQIQWLNFAAWLLVAALLFTEVSGLWALGQGIVQAKSRSTRFWLFFVTLLATAITGTVNSFVHARDAWGTMPTGLTLSLVTLILAIAATWLGLTTSSNKGDRA